MRTIKYNLLNRLVLQAEEAEYLGMTKLASHLTNQIEQAKLREDSAFYSYAHNSFQQDVEDCLWKVAIRAADYYDANLDSQETQEIIEQYAQDLISDLRQRIFKISEDVGAFEPSLPGEISMTNIMEVSEEVE